MRCSTCRRRPESGEVFQKRRMLNVDGKFVIRWYCSEACKIQGLIDEHPGMTNKEFIAHVKTEHGIDLNNYDKVAGRIIKVR